MAPLLFSLSILATIGTVWTIYSLFCLYRNYVKARTIGIPIRILLVDHVNILWLLVDKQVTSLVRRLPGPLGNNNFTRFNYRGWHEHDKLQAHEEMGQAFALVSPSNIWVYIADPNALEDLYRRGKEFPRWVEITKMLNVFGGPNIATSSGEQWRSQRKIVNACLNEKCNVAVWSAAASLGEDMAHYWARKGVFTSVGEDSRTLSLGVLSRTCFGQPFPFEGHDERNSTSALTSFRLSLLMIMENALLISALGTNMFLNAWLPLPRSWRNLGEACVKFRGHMTHLYNQKLRALTTEGHLGGDSTLMASLIRASQKKEDGKGLTEAEIYGNMFVVSFAGHDTTAHLLTYAMFFLACNPPVQDWLAQELRQVLGDRPQQDWDYHADFPRLKRCMAILYETLRVKTLVAEVKWTSKHTQSLEVSGQTLSLPPGTLIIPSYMYVHRHPQYWGPDAEEWKPARWIKEPCKRLRQEAAIPADQHSVQHDSELGGLGDDDKAEVLRSPPSRGNFLGWSEGARDCPGKRFSQVEWVAMLAALFRDWEVEPVRLGSETSTDQRARVLKFIEDETDYGGLLLQLMHPERLPLSWKRRS